MDGVVVPYHLLLGDPLGIHGHALVHQVLILTKLLIRMLLPIDCLVGVPPLLQSLLILLVLAVDHVVVLHVLGDCRGGPDGVEIVCLDCVLDRVIHLTMELCLMHRELLVLVHPGDRAHSRLRRLLFVQILLLVDQVLLVLLLYLRVVQRVVLPLRDRILVLDILRVLPMDWAILLGEVLRVRLNELPRAWHALADGLEGIATILLQSRVLRSLNLFGAVRVSSRLMLHLGILVSDRARVG